MQPERYHEPQVTHGTHVMLLHSRREINALKQPEGSKLCGHTCVAMIGNTPIDFIVELIGHRRGTTAKDIAKVLRHLGFQCPDRRVLGVPTSGVALVTVRYKPGHVPNTKGAKWWSHWVLYFHGSYYCPSSGGLCNYVRHEPYNMTSHLPVTI